ncbi:RING finger protein 24 isoform X1 [Mobula birostris]|uniref:RING finger protein 24 isoform X1 n=1 Tax=Mobula birostris TaxID=1983395 RepID=UPI003B27CF23
MQPPPAPPFCRQSMSSELQLHSFKMPNIGFQNLPLNIYIVVFGTAIFVFILSLLFCCYLIRLRHQAHKELYAYKQVILKEKVKELNLHERPDLPEKRAEKPRSPTLYREPQRPAELMTYLLQMLTGCPDPAVSPVICCWM